MAKRALSAILILLLLLPAVIAAGGVLFALESPFASFDKAREDALEESLGELFGNQTESELLPEENRSIIRFKNEATLTEIKDALGDMPYRLLAESECRLFVVADGNGDFTERHADIIDYSEPDLVRSSQAITNDPIIFPAYESMGVYTAWDTVRADSNVVVAVLDTGVDRGHEDLVGANILAGYDAVNGKSGVNGDSAGHGTAVIGLLAAVADNGMGIAGIAHGVTILPVKVSAVGTTIYSSDLISGIRFAADAGARIINMSLGGYSESVAEQEAVNYAVSKGCILISAAGNGGMHDYADQKSYPASYEGVISVASCGTDGQRSDFSQYNDSVDIAAMGENITALAVEDGVSIYKTDSGTSYSCAFVSGMAALVATQLGDVRFESGEFLALLIDSCGSKRDDELGYGIINLPDMLFCASRPIITGVYDGGVFSEAVRIGFNRGTATLDGMPIDDGETVITTGYHTLIVTTENDSRTVRFRLNYDPLSYNLREFASFAYFEFDRGTALLDGFPYESQQKITASGRHEFVLTDGDETLTKTVVLQYAVPDVYGIENGGVYDHPVDIRIVGDGSATLDGKRVYGEVSVIENGLHTLYVQSGNGAITEKYEFTIDFPYAETLQYDYENATAAVDEENGYICIYGESLVGARIYDISSLGQYSHFLHIGRVYDHAFVGDDLLLIGENGVTAVSRALAMQGEVAVRETISPDGMDLYAYGDGVVYCFGNESIYTLDLATGEAVMLSELGFDCEVALYSDGKLCLASPSVDRLIRIYDCESGAISELVSDSSLLGAPMYFGEGYVAVRNRLLDSTSGITVLEFCSDFAVAIRGDLLFTDNRIIDIPSGRELGSFAFSVSDIAVTDERTYLFGVESYISVIGTEAEGIYAYGAAERLDVAFSQHETVNEYRENFYYDRYSSPKSAAASENNIFFLISDRNALYSFDTSVFAENSPLPLRFIPERVVCSGGYIAVCFESAPEIYIAPEDDTANGIYVELPAKCDSLCIVGDKVFAVSNGRIVTFDTDGGSMAVTSVRAELISAAGERLVVKNGSELLLYNTSLVRLYAVDSVDGRLLTDGDYTAVGNTVYNIETLTEYVSLEDKILAISGNTLITEKGVFSLALNEYVGSLGIKAEIAVIGKNNAVYSFGSSTVSVCRFTDGSEVVDLPEISGVEAGGVYHDSVDITYSLGVGFLDGKPFASSDSATETGRHTLLIALPCGRSVTVEFVVEAHVSGIEFLVSERFMSIGERINLRVRYLPEGASSLPVTFTCESDGLQVSENGETVALAVGKYTVTATVETHVGAVTADCTITVRDNLISFSSESGITIDRDNGFALGVSAGTTEKQLIDLLVSGGKAELTDRNGKPVKQFVGTGCRLVLKDSDGVIADALTLVVKGDTDGDGCITAYDLYEHGRILRGYQYGAEYVLSADMDDNGNVDDSDYRALRNIILGRTEYEIGTPVSNLFGKCTVQTVSRIESDIIIDVVVCISGCKYARGVSGAVEYNGLEFISGEALGWESGCYDLGGKVSFYAHKSDGTVSGKAFNVLLNLRFRVTAQPGETISFGGNSTIAYEDTSKTVRFESVERAVVSSEYGDFGIFISNADSFTFDPDVNDYTVVIPYDSALADISITRGEGQTVSVNGVAVSDSGEGLLTVSVTDQNGQTEFYNIQLRRKSEPKFDTNCRLETLETEGFHLSPSFDPDVLEYSISVPFGTKKINIYCVAQNRSAEIIIGDTTLYGEVTPITVTVATPDGESLVYTINVTVLPEEEPIPEDSSTPESIPVEEEKGSWVGLAVAIIAIALGALAIYIVKRSKNEIK